MPSYQSPTALGDPTGRWLTFTAAVSAATRDWLATNITRRRHKIRSRWRLLDPTTQATLVLAFLRTNLTYAELAAANHISRSTCRRIINEGIDLLAERAIRLSEVLRLAKQAGWEYLLIDGVNVPTVAFARKLNRRNSTTRVSTAATGSTCRPSAPPRRAAAVGLGRPTRQGQRHHRRAPPRPAREDRQAAGAVGGPGPPTTPMNRYSCGPNPAQQQPHPTPNRDRTPLRATEPEKRTRSAGVVQCAPSAASRPRSGTRS
jgi:hypothetical protein